MKDDPVTIKARKLFRVQSAASTLAEEQMYLESSRPHDSEQTAFSLSLHPGFNSCRQDILNNEANFLPSSRVDVLTVSGPENTLLFEPDCDDVQVEAVIDGLNSDASSPALMAICIKLERNLNATFEQRASISKPLVENLFNHYGIHTGFLLDVIGRPNYWSALSQLKTDSWFEKDMFEFFCQHPRWHQKGRYDKEQGAMQGNRAPCSVYMSYSTATKTTIYLVVAPDDGIWFSFLDLITEPQNNNIPFLGRELVTSPFMIHSMISNIAFEQSTIYTADVRVRLMTQLKKVNDYSDSLDAAGVQSHDSNSRQTLSSITRQLHQVSQMINTGLGSSSSAVKLSAKLLEAHQRFCEQTGRGAPGTAVSRTNTAIQYVHDAYLYQQHWLEQYKTRKETAMSFVFNMVTQGDSYINLNTSHQMSQDSSSIHTLTILAMIFLPGTFTATLFSCVAFRASDSGAAEVTGWLLPSPENQ
ncbi:hypothetical protein F53441_11651 [Fusarium austroafricanum]|uniref:Uncharacterized protein n=1 Tax=Fusarium austroafricanum TaxID=2364996 RepID=A0A8H4K4W2_9HYPO|nr:hypothetical protein F53441_11651 [Fusarium austroafricanum]